jgi:hypothetical protein
MLDNIGKTPLAKQLIEESYGDQRIELPEIEL